MKQTRQSGVPDLALLERELARVTYRCHYRHMLRSTVSMLIVVAAIAVLVVNIWMPVLRIQGSSMSPTLKEGQILVSLKSKTFQRGDLMAFYLGNKILVKRCIAGPGQWVDLDEEGSVYVDGVLLEEPYLAEKAFGECDITLPVQVPEGCYFCMGDCRAISVDSRNTAVGFVAEEQIVGKITFRVWPLVDFGPIHGRLVNEE